MHLIRFPLPNHRPLNTYPQEAPYSIRLLRQQLLPNLQSNKTMKARILQTPNNTWQLQYAEITTYLIGTYQEGYNPNNYTQHWVNVGLPFNTKEEAIIGLHIFINPITIEVQGNMLIEKQGHKTISSTILYNKEE